MKNNKEEEKKQDILKILKDFGRLPTGRISAIVGIYYNSTKDILEVLEKEGRIISEKAGELAIYWRLKEK